MYSLQPLFPVSIHLYNSGSLTYLKPWDISLVSQTFLWSKKQFNTTDEDNVVCLGIIIEGV